MRFVRHISAFLKQKPFATSWRIIHDAGDKAIGNIVFLHGLDGDSISTWNFENNDENWSSWILSGVPGVNIASIGYRIRSSKWSGGSMHLSERAINILALLSVRLNSKLPTVFICHSYGGLLVKQMLRSAADVALEYRPVFESVRGIVFFGTPHSGASLADYLTALSMAYQSSVAIEELRFNNTALIELNQWFRNRITPDKVRVLIFFESMETYGIQVVGRSSADPGVNGVTPIAVDCDHIDLPKPTDRTDVRISLVNSFILNLFASGAPRVSSELAPMRRVIAARDDELKNLVADLRIEIDQNPGDIAKKKALARAEEQLKAISRRNARARFDRMEMNIDLMGFNSSRRSKSVAYPVVLYLLMLLWILNSIYRIIHGLFW